MTAPPTVWALIDDRAGNASQVRGVVQALGLRHQVMDLAYTAAGALPNFFIGATFAHLTRDSRINLVPPWPDLVIAAGRRTAPVARNIKQLARGSAFLVQIMYPGDAGIDEFDLVAVPNHDQVPPRSNFLSITGAPHRVMPEDMAAAAEEWRGRFDHLPAPRIALIVGGATKRRPFTAEMAADLGRRASRLAAAAGGSLLVTTSRRTGEAAEALLGAIEAPSFVFRWGQEGANPYLAYLAVADGVIVTGESVSMCSEACASPGPVYIYAPPALVVRKYSLLHEELYAKGYARPLGETFEHWAHPPLNAAYDIAAEVRRRLGL